ncbi:diaminopimelate epimerase [bacterium]|nr:diaminopimelate epimerase [bacterium]
MSIPFSKLSGTGNDFIVIDNREGLVAPDRMRDFVAAVCRRAISVGADGVIFVENHPTLDFAWHYFNADGGEAEMCGNGARCVSRFAFERGIAGKSMRFATVAGTIESEITPLGVKVKLTPPSALRPVGITIEGGERIDGTFVNTGVPHVVVPVQDIEAVDMRRVGRLIRYHAEFAPAGTNANFVAPGPGGEFLIRTYERGVEDETLACGTGNVAAAITLVHNKKSPVPVRLRVRSGELLTVHLDANDPISGDVALEGPTRWIYDGVLHPESYEGR